MTRFVVTRLARTFGSLQMAVTLLPLLAGILALGALLESWYDSRVTQQLVYNTWWFGVLLGLLWINIFCAAAKKWPWKKHQIGFLITHLGLLTLVLGGMATALGGVTGAMILVDSESDRARHFGPASADLFIDRDREILSVARPHGGEPVVADFAPGPLPWSDVAELDPAVGPFTRSLNWLAHPLPRVFSMPVEPGVTLEVLAFYPHAIHQPFAPAPPNERGFPAIQVELASPTVGVRPAEWIAATAEKRVVRLGPGMMEMLARDCRPEQLAEFKRAPKDIGKKGELVLGLAGQVFRFDIERLTDKAPLGDTGWHLQVEKYMPDFRDEKSATPANPGLALVLTRADGVTASMATVARQQGELFPWPKDTKIPWHLLQDFWVWVHPSDAQYGDPSLKALLQFVTDRAGALHFRTFSSAGPSEAGKANPFHFEKTGSASEGAGRQSIWSGMQWKFQITKYLPRATPGPHFIPVHRRLGHDDPETVQALRCLLTSAQSTRDFWVGKSERAATMVQLGDKDYLVGYHPARHPLDFTLKLLRAEQTTDQGSTQPASQSSLVLLTDPSSRILGQTELISLNQPLSHRGYKVYQSSYQLLGADETGKPISRSVLNVGHDPGLWLKYAGSTMLALGIACMFTMKAYFFKYLKRTA